MNLLTPDHLAKLTQQREGPCLSLYLPTHRHHPENLQDPIRFSGLVSHLDAILRKHGSSQTIDELLTPFTDLTKDFEFWKHTLDGLAIFSSPGFSEVILLQRPVKELSVVSESFHTKPLRKLLQSTANYRILALTLQTVKVYEGNRDSLDEMDLGTGFPTTIAEALGEELTESHQTVASYGGTAHGMRHGHGGRNDEIDLDRDRFFRVVDRALLEIDRKGFPLILAALPEHHHAFHSISQNPALLKDGIKINPDGLNLDEMRKKAWEVLEPFYQARVETLSEKFHLAQSQGLGVDDLGAVAEAVYLGKVATFFIEADREIPGRIHPGSGRITLDDTGASGVDDLLDDLGENVLKKGGEVHVFPASQMPTSTGVAAICRY